MKSILWLMLIGLVLMMNGLVTDPAATQNTLRTDAFAVHQVVTVQDGRGGVRGFEPCAAADGPSRTCHISKAVAAPFAFNELIPSWNFVVPAGTAYRVEVRVGRGTEWSAWYWFGDATTLAHEAVEYRAITRDAWGRVNTDYLTLERPCERFEVRVTNTKLRERSAVSGQHSAISVQQLAIERFTVCVSNTTSDKRLWTARRAKPRRVDAALYTRRLDVPFMTQHVDDPELIGNICSSTSVAMVMAYRGVRKTPGEVARAAYDAEHKIYGNWPLNVQAAFSFGVPGYVTRFGDWDAVRAVIAAGQPIIASIRDPDGRLKGTPYKTTVGHLLVIRGFDAKGDVLVNDPAGRDAKAGQLTYDRGEFEEAWLRKGGVGYILEERK